MAKKTPCPVTRKEFLANAKPIIIKIGDESLTALHREFSTGSLGWYLNGKTTMEIAGKHVAVQIGLNLTVVGSKELPKDAPPLSHHTAEAPHPS
jgi:hypothetical protein